MRPRRHPAGLLVTLHPLLGSEEADSGSAGDPQVIEVDGGYYAGIAYHYVVPCVLDEPCTRFQYGVDQRNVLIVLRHEELHHVFGRIGEDKANEMLDNVMTSITLTCRKLGCKNHQVGR